MTTLRWLSARVYTALTPIALANAYATFANGGTRYAPEVAAAIVNPHGKVVIRYTPRVLGHVSLPASVRDPILQGLSGVVNSPSGTGYRPLPAATSTLVVDVRHRGQDGHGEQRAERGAELALRWLWARRSPRVRGAVRDRRRVATAPTPRPRW